MNTLSIHNVVPGDHIVILDSATNAVIHVHDVKADPSNCNAHPYCLICKVYLDDCFTHVEVRVMSDHGTQAFSISVALAEGATDCYVAGNGDPSHDKAVALIKYFDYKESSLCPEMLELAKYYGLV